MFLLRFSSSAIPSKRRYNAIYHDLIGPRVVPVVDISHLCEMRRLYAKSVQLFKKCPLIIQNLLKYGQPK